MSDLITLIIADENAVDRELVCAKAVESGYGVVEAASPEGILEIIHTDNTVQALLIDVFMYESSGESLLESIKSLKYDLPVIMLTTASNIRTATNAMTHGVFDYILKPVDIEKLDSVVKNALSLTRLIDEVDSLKVKIRRGNIFKSIVGESEALEELFKSVEVILNKDVNVLIQGESGTGKELVAMAIHNAGKRSNGPFIAVNCASVTQEIAESLFFGHKKGSFSGAIADHPGYFEQADGGTLFLDEIGDMPLEVQTIILRPIENRRIRRVGDKVEKEINIRIVSATNKNLQQAINMGEFRQDLYYRLEEYPLFMPPLRERKSDIPVLANHFLNEVCDFYEFGRLIISDEAIVQLTDYDWPGNVRELKNIIRRTAVQSTGNVIEKIDIPAYTENHLIHYEKIQTKREVLSRKTDLNVRPLEQLEREEIEKAYRLTNGNPDRSAMLLGISRATLYRKLKLYGIQNFE